MTFAYQARQAGGQTLAGTIDAIDLAEARRVLRGKGLFPTSLEAADASSARRGAASPAGRVRKDQLAEATAEMALMIGSGVDVAEAIRAIAERDDGSPIAAAMREVYESIASGVPASAALARRGDVFDDAYVASVSAGEASGNVAEVLERLAELQRHEIELIGTVRGLVAYPLVLVAACCVVLVVAVLFVLPQFADVFDGMDTPPPVTTRALLATALFAKAHVAEIGGLAAAAAAVAALWLRSPAGKLWRDDLVVGLPKLGPVACKLITARLFRQLGVLVRGGLPLLEAVRLCRTSTGHARFRRTLAEIESKVLAGGSLSPVIEAAKHIPPGASRMIRAAEASGTLGEVLDDVGRRYEADGRRELTGLAKIAEPAVVLVMGLFVGGIVMSVMLPLLEMTSSAGGM